jgi:hypothetical protein
MKRLWYPEQVLFFSFAITTTSGLGVADSSSRRNVSYYSCVYLQLVTLKHSTDISSDDFVYVITFMATLSFIFF